jgi:hypothetical protein
MTASLIALAIGVASTLFCLRRRAWIDALLVLSATVALAGLLGGFTLPAAAPASMTVAGDGLRAAQWDDLPARPLNWTAPADPVVRLDFPRELALGRVFELRMRRGTAGPARLQLVAENGQVLAEAAGADAALSVRWLPPLAEAMLLEARLLDGAGKLLAKGPVPLVVLPAQPLRVQGRFASPSFDARVLNDLLAASNALLDWQVVLGKAVVRGENSREPMTEPDLLVMDAAWIERLPAAARAALLAQVDSGRRLLILGASARDAGFWLRALQLELKAEAEGAKSAGPMALAVAPFNPVQVAQERIWTRAWGKGRITWLGVSDWHRYAISEPQVLGLWWQDVLDQAGVQRGSALVWQAIEGMPMAGERLALCASGVKEDARWRRRPEQADAACLALWPAAPGWLEVQGRKVYVYADGDWPLWQKALRRDATALYAARTPVAQVENKQPLPAWPFGLVFIAAMLTLWWRERKGTEP